MTQYTLIAHLEISDAERDLIDRFTDRLMEALFESEQVIDPAIHGSLANGYVCIEFALEASSREEADSLLPRELHAAIKGAGVRPTHQWTDVPDVPLEGELDEDDEVSDFIASHPDMVRRVQTELVDA